MVFPFNLVNHITGQLSFGDILQPQEKLSMNSQAIQIPCNQIGHDSIIYDIPTCIQFNPFPCTLLKNVVDPGFIAQYVNMGGLTYQKNKHSKQQYKALED